MEYTLGGVLSSPILIGYIIDRIKADQTDPVLWRRLLTPRVTTNNIFKSLYGTKSVTRMASVIDGLSNKPIRSRKGFGDAMLEVIPMGNKFQMDNARLEQIQQLVEMLNAGSINEAEFVNTLTDDIRELVLAPEKRIDKILSDLIFNGEAVVNLSNNPDGVELDTFEVPITQASITGNLVTELVKAMQEYRHLGIGVMEMSRTTFFERFATNTAFQSEITRELGSKTVKVTASGLLTEDEVNAYFKMIGLPQISVIDGLSFDVEGKGTDLAPKDKVVLRPAGMIGNMRYHRPYELIDKVDGKTYVERENGLFIATSRTNEGRFIECGCEWVPEITVPQQIVSLDISGIKA